MLWISAFLDKCAYTCFCISQYVYMCVITYLCTYIYEGMWITSKCHWQSSIARPKLLIVEPKDISTASVRDLCPFMRSTGLLNLC
jgi:hypothetical protein